MKWTEENLSVCIKVKEKAQIPQVSLVCQHLATHFFKVAQEYEDADTPSHLLSKWPSVTNLKCSFFSVLAQTESRWVDSVAVMRLKRHILVFYFFLLFLSLSENVNLTFRDNLRSKMCCAVKRVCLTQISRERIRFFYVPSRDKPNTTTRVYRWTFHHYRGFLCLFVYRFSFCGTGSLISLNPPLRHNLSCQPVVRLCAVPCVCVFVFAPVWAECLIVCLPREHFLISSSLNPRSCCACLNICTCLSLVFLLHLVCLCVLMGATVPRLSYRFFSHPIQRVVQTVLPSFNNKTGHETKKQKAKSLCCHCHGLDFCAFDHTDDEHFMLLDAKM